MLFLFFLFFFYQFDTELLIFLFLQLFFLCAMIVMIVGFFLVSGPAHISNPSVSTLTFCECVYSWRRASVNSLAQKKAAQWRDAKLAQLLTQNDEVRDVDFIPSIVEWVEVSCREGRDGKILHRPVLLVERWWEFGWMGGGKLGVAEEVCLKLCKRRSEEKCPGRIWLFRMPCCQLLMTELK